MAPFLLYSFFAHFFALRVGKVGVRYILSHISKAQFSRCLTDESSFFLTFFSLFFENSQKVDSLTLSDKIVCKSEWVARHTEGGAKMGKKLRQGH